MSHVTFKKRITLGADPAGGGGGGGSWGSGSSLLGDPQTSYTTRYNTSHLILRPCWEGLHVACHILKNDYVRGRSSGGGGGVLGVRTLHFGRPPNFIKREKALFAYARKRRVSVLNSYPDPPPPPPPPFRNPVSAPVCSMCLSLMNMNMQFQK